MTNFTFDCWQLPDKTLMESAEFVLCDTMGDAWTEHNQDIELVSATPQRSQEDPDWFIAKVRCNTPAAYRAVKECFR